MTTTITQVTYRWDDQCGVEPGWYCESRSGDTMIDDSQKVWFPICVDDYGRDQAGALEDALREAYPDAEIVAR